MDLRLQIIYIYIPDSAIDNLQWLIWHKTKPDLAFPGLSELGSNSYKGLLHTPKNCCVTIRCSLVSELGHPIFFLGVVLTHLRYIQSAYSEPRQLGDSVV